MDITVEELKQKLDNEEKFIFIDVREAHEYEEFNLNGKLVPLGTIMQAIEELEEIKDEEIVVYCRSGARSAAAQNLMQQRGFTNVRNLIGGVLAWKDKFPA